jgi:hypothetical protein
MNCFGLQLFVRIVVAPVLSGIFSVSHLHSLSLLRTISYVLLFFIRIISLINCSLVRSISYRFIDFGWDSFDEETKLKKRGTYSFFVNYHVLSQSPNSVLNLPVFWNHSKCDCTLSNTSQLTFVLHPRLFSISPTPHGDRTDDLTCHVMT